VSGPDAALRFGPVRLALAKAHLEKVGPRG